MAINPNLVKSPNQTLQDILETIRAGLIAQGVANPQVGPGTDINLTGQALTNALALFNQQILFAADSQMPDTAVGPALDRILAIYGLQRKPASQATGQITLESTQATLVPTGSLLTGPTGLSYEVVAGGIFADGASIVVRSIDTGVGVNLEVGSILSWNNTPAFAQQTAVVSVAIAGGSPLEDDSTARARLLGVLQNPPQFGNWIDIAKLAESLDPIVQKAFVYSCANGPATTHVAITANQNKDINLVTRDVPAYNLDNVANGVTGNTPEYVETLTTTVDNIGFDIVFKLTIPYPIGASNNGTGEGWLDFSPWPNIQLGFISGYQPCAVTAITSATNFTLYSLTGVAPTEGVTRIQWIDKAAGWIVRTATVLTAVDNLDTTWTITTDFPFSGMVVGDYISPASTHAQDYVNACLAQFALMGPGEKTDIATLLPRAIRQPRPSIAFPNNIDSVMLRSIINSGDEVLSCDYWYRKSLDSPPNIDNAPPNLPTLITDPPKIYIPNQIGFIPSGL